MAVEKGNEVTVDYTGSLEDGTVFDASEKHGQPLKFIAGGGQVIKGFDDAVLGMEKGEEKEITLQPAEAYGDPRPDMKKDIPRDQLPADPEPKEGMMLMVGLPTGQQLPARIDKVEGDNVTIDLNHPLAGKVLKFKIKIVDYGKAPEGGCAGGTCGGGCCE